MKQGLFCRWAALGTALLLTLLCGCGGQEPSISAPSSAPETTTTTAAPPYALNRLTGLRDMKTDNDRPIGFVVTDETSSLVQIGLESADFFFEAETEGGIPRILAVYSSIDRIPESIGPVRSARPHFVKIAKALDMIYCHIGGSPSGLDSIKQMGVTDITNAYIIHPTLKASKNFSWNRSAFTAEKVNAAISKWGIATTSSYSSPYQFGAKSGSQTANLVNVKISESYSMAFSYDAQNGVYLKHRNSPDTPVHTTSTGGTIEVSNVIAIYGQRSVDEVYTYDKGTDKQTTRYNFDMKSGSGTLASGGTAREIRYRCTEDGLKFFESDGTTPLTVAEGKTFVCLASTTLRSRTVIQ